MDPSEPSAVPTPRRRFLARLSLGLSGLIATAATVPVIGFLLSPLTRKSPRVWRPVGPVDAFAIGETVNVAFEDASPLPWAGVTAHTAAWLRRDDATHFTAFTVHCTHLGLPRALVRPTRSSSSARAMAACTTPTAPSPPGPRPSRCRSIRCGCGTARSRFSPARSRSSEPRVIKPASRLAGRPQRPDHRRAAARSSTRCRRAPDGGTSSAAPRSSPSSLQVATGHRARHRVRPVERPGLRQPPVHLRAGAARPLPPGDALLRRVGHGAADRHPRLAHLPHGARTSSPASSTGSRGAVLLLLTLALAFTGQLLRWDQKAVGRSSWAPRRPARMPVVGRGDRALHSGGRHDRRRDAEPVLRVPRVLHSGVRLRAHRPAPGAGPAPRHLGAARDGERGGPGHLSRALRRRCSSARACRSGPTPPGATWSSARRSSPIVLLALDRRPARAGPAARPEHPRGLSAARLVLPLVLRAARARAQQPRDARSSCSGRSSSGRSLLLLPVFNTGARSVRRRPWAPLLVVFIWTTIVDLLDRGRAGRLVARLRGPAAAGLRRPRPAARRSWRAPGCSTTRAASSATQWRATAAGAGPTSPRSRPA